VRDYQAIEMIMEVFFHGMTFTRTEAIELIDRLILIHSIVYKKKEDKRVRR